MRAITLRQPYAHLIAVGAKKFETRSWATKHRGRIAIHSAKAIHYPTSEVLAIMKEMGIKRTDPEYSKVICTANLVECIKIDASIIEIAKISQNYEYDLGRWDLGGYAWQLEDIRMLDTPIKITGRQRMWTIPDHLIPEEYR